jgi:hypothetical protein
MDKKTHHVVPSPSGGWGVKKGGATRAAKIFDTKKEAESFAREVSIRAKSELVVHRRDGTIQRKDSHGRDPLPPRDK